VTVSFRFNQAAASLKDRYEAMTERVRAQRAMQPEASVSDPDAVNAELEAWADSRREVNTRIL
jgi:hypothetical protein